MFYHQPKCHRDAFLSDTPLSANHYAFFGPQPALNLKKQPSETPENTAIDSELRLQARILKRECEALLSLLDEISPPLRNKIMGYLRQLVKKAKGRRSPRRLRAATIAIRRLKYSVSRVKKSDPPATHTAQLSDPKPLRSFR